MGKIDMYLSSRFLAQAIKAAGVGAALMLSVSAGYAQSGPFAGFEGTWSGIGTVALSDGTIERIRCNADSKSNGTALAAQRTPNTHSVRELSELARNCTS